MKKILFIILFVSVCNIVSADTRTSTLNRNQNDIECPSVVSHGVTHYGVPNSISSSAPTSGSVGCTNHTYYRSSNHNITFVYNNGGITACPAGERAVFLNEASRIITCQKWDDTPPNIPTDIISTPNSNILSVDNYNYQVLFNNGGQAPITNVSGEKENYNNTSNTAFTMSCSSSNCSNIWNIKNVDLPSGQRQSNGGRQYTFTLQTVCDEAGNCWNGTQSYNHNVYANTDLPYLTTKTFDGDSLNNSNNIADGSDKNLKITLKDIYGNAIIPASGITRTIHFNFNTENKLYLNQKDRSGGSSVYASTEAGSSSYSNTNFLTGSSIFANQNSSNGEYDYKFKFYTPTGNQNYGVKSDNLASFKINSIILDIKGTLGGVSSLPLTGNSIDAKINPLFRTIISGGIKDNGIAEGSRQKSQISLEKNSLYGGSITPNIKLSFGGTDSNKFEMRASNLVDYYNTTIINSNLNDFKNNTSIGYYDLYSKMIQKPGQVGSRNRVYLATHITYDITSPNGTITPIYNSDIIGKTNFFEGEGYISYQSSLKVLGQVTSKSKNAITDGQFPSDVKMVGNVDKFISKTEIIKNGYNFAKNINSISSNNINSISSNNIDLSLPGVNNILYYGKTSSTDPNTEVYNLGNGSDISINNKKTILVIGGNVYIKNNLYYTGASNPTLGIIVLKDKQGKGGNIYIDPSVTNIVGILFAEKSIIGYDGTDEIDGSTEILTLKNQLHIYGSVFSENTIGGSRESTARCPYFVSTCTLEDAQKYDLNYLRRYYLIEDPLNSSYKKPANNGKPMGGGNYISNGNITGYNFNYKGYITNTSQPYAGNSVVIEYNPSVQKNPPPLFEIKK